MANRPAPDDQQSRRPEASTPAPEPVRDPYRRWRAFAAGQGTLRRPVTPHRAWAVGAQDLWTRNR